MFVRTRDQVSQIDPVFSECVSRSLPNGEP